VADSGSAYVFDVATGQQLSKLTASDPGTDDSFGDSVAISGEIAIVGARHDDDGGSNSGSAYLFDLDGAAPHISTITPHRGSNAGGNTVSILGDAFTPDATVTFGGLATSVTFVSAAELQVIVPACRLAASSGNPRRLAIDVDVVVATPGGSDTKANGYTYVFKR